MSDRLTIVAEPRALQKKGNQLRRDGIIPAIVYGQGEPEPIQIENIALRRVLRVVGTNQLVELEIEGKTKVVLAREIQQHATRGELIHVDFLEVDMQGTVTSEATLVTINKAKPELEYIGVGVLSLQSVQIEASPNDLISEIEVDMSQIETPDQVLYVSDLVVPEGITLLTDLETVVARIEITREEEVEEEEDLDAIDVEVPEIGEEEEDESF